MRKRALNLIIIGTLFLLVLVAGCKDDVVVLQSKWGRSDFEGIQSLVDRSRPMTYLDEERMNIGLQNDADNLYLILRTSDKNVQSSVRHGGFTIWFDSTGAENKIIGIRYPLGSKAPPMPLSREKRLPKEKKAHPDSTELNKGPAINPDTVVNLDTVQILGPQVNRQKKFIFNGVPNLAVSLTDTQGTMIYELRVPLKVLNDSSIAIGAKPGSTIGLGFESGRAFRSFPPKDSLERNAPGENGGEFGGPVGGIGYGGNPPPRRKPEMMNGAIGFWIKVKLASSAVK